MVPAAALAFCNFMHLQIFLPVPKGLAGVFRGGHQPPPSYCATPACDPPLMYPLAAATNCNRHPPTACYLLRLHHTRVRKPPPLDQPRPRGLIPWLSVQPPPCRNSFVPYHPCTYPVPLCALSPRTAYHSLCFSCDRFTEPPRSRADLARVPGCPPTRPLGPIVMGRMGAGVGGRRITDRLRVPVVKGRARQSTNATVHTMCTM